MPIPADPGKYQTAKAVADKAYGENVRSPFKSGFLVNYYKNVLKGTYVKDDKEKKLKRWFDEKWININPVVGKSQDTYAFFRPTVKVSEKTPKLAQNISKQELSRYVNKKEQQLSKQGLERFQPIEPKIGGMIVKTQPYSKGMFDNLP